MNKTKMMILAAAVGSLLTASAFATDTENYRSHYSVVRTDIPLPAKVVSPSLPERYRERSVELTMVIDEQGRPQQIELLGKQDPTLASELLPVVSQWRFTPAQKDGQAVACRIVLPLRFV